MAAALDAGADVNAGDEDGWTALHRAASNGHTHVVKLLVLRGANVDARTIGGEQGRTAALLLLRGLSGQLGIDGVVDYFIQLMFK